MPVMFQFAERKRARETAEAQARDWKTQEIAELYRVRDRLAEAGLSVALATGVSDEGEPWAVFEQMDTSEVVVHIARIDGELIVANAATGATYRGRDFRAVADGMLDGAPLALPRKSAGSNVVIHPRSVLTAFVAAAVVLAEVARSVEQAQAAEAQTRQDVAETAQDGFLAIFFRILNRDGNAPATFAGGVVFGAVAAAIIATTLADPTETTTDDAGTSVATDVIADPNVASVRLDTEGEAPRSRDERVETQVADQAESAGSAEVRLADLPNLDDATVGVEIASQAPSDQAVVEPGSAKASAETSEVSAEELPVETTEEARRPTETASTETTAAAARTTTARSETATSTSQPSSDGAKSAERGPALADVTRKVADSITVVKLDADFDAAKAPSLIGADKPIAIALASLDLLQTDAGKGKADGEVVLDLVADETGGPDALLGEGGVGSSSETPVDGPAAEPVPPPPLMNITFHDASFASSQHAFMKGVIDVLLFTGGEARIDHFDFGEDLLVVDGGSSLVGWLKDVEVVGSDVKITGVDGSIIWLNDSYHTIA